MTSACTLSLCRLRRSRLPGLSLRPGVSLSTWPRWKTLTSPQILAYSSLAVSHHLAEGQPHPTPPPSPGSSEAWEGKSILGNQTWSIRLGLKLDDCCHLFLDVAGHQRGGRPLSSVAGGPALRIWGMGGMMAGGS